MKVFECDLYATHDAPGHSLGAGGSFQPHNVKYKHKRVMQVAFRAVKRNGGELLYDDNGRITYGYMTVQYFSHPNFTILSKPRLNTPPVFGWKRYNHENI